jgi:hypothetical protein
MSWFNNVLGGIGYEGGQIVETENGLPVEMREHFVFLIDTSWSMDLGFVSQQFPRIHGELLDMLAENHPGSVVSCLTFCFTCHTQYVACPVDEAPCLTMGNEKSLRDGTDLPLAICTDLKRVVNRYIADDITVIIVTDGDTSSPSKVPIGQTKGIVRNMRDNGVRFILLFADNQDTSDKPARHPGESMLDYAARNAKRVGIKRNEVYLWGHSPESLMSTFKEVGEVLALGATHHQHSSIG